MKASELHARMERSDVELLDVRTELEFNQGHLPGARNIPLDRLQADGSFTPRTQPAPCASSARAANAPKRPSRTSKAHAASKAASSKAA